MSARRRKTTRARRPSARPRNQIALPVAPRTARRLIIGSLTLLIVATGAVWATAARVPERVKLAVATRASAAGFTIRHVEISGTVHLPRLSIYQEVLQGGSDSIWLADLSDMRQRLRELPWVQDVRIERHWPDRIAVHVTERQPAALWQEQGVLHLIDLEGVVLPVDDLQEFAELPLLVGDGAHAHAGAFLPLIADHPTIARQMEAALWISDRRWDMRMKTGETISLPEGTAAAAALQRFADIDRVTPLLGQGFLRFDMRIPDKLVVRVDKDPGEQLKPRRQSPSMQPGAASRDSARYHQALGSQPGPTQGRGVA